MSGYDILPIETARLRLRRPEGMDAEALFNMRCDPEVAKFQGWKPLSLADATKFCVEMSEAPFCKVGVGIQITVAEKETDEFIGDLYVNAHSTDTVEIGYSLSRKWQLLGLATEALTALIDALFNRTGAITLLGITHCENRASIRLLERCGFEHEAVNPWVVLEPDELLFVRRKPLNAAQFGEA